MFITTSKDAKIISADLVDNSIEIIRRYPSNMCYASGKPIPDKVIKEIYTVVDGKIALTNEITGKLKPSYVVPDTISFE